MNGLSYKELTLEGADKFMMTSVGKGRGIFLQVEVVQKEDFIEIPQKDLQLLLSRFQGVFEEPTDLPPLRAQDHKIVLEERTSPISTRPYRYPCYHKTEIEKTVNELLNSGVIRPSSSPLFSPSVVS